MKLTLNQADFVRRLLAAHHAGCNLDPKDDVEVRLWHLLATLIGFAISEGINISGLFDDAMNDVVENDVHPNLSFSFERAAPFLCGEG